METIFARNAWLDGNWASNVRLTLDGALVGSVEAGVQPSAGDTVHDLVVPGMPNLHSHAFQRAMAGLTEVRGPADDSFWSWRTLMYKFALSMTPEQVEAVAAQLYMEMLEAGFARVGEFHYLHHDRAGRPYADIAEMGARIAAAAQETGISLTLLPVFYAHAGFGGAAPADGQRRFVNSLDSFSRLMERSRAIAAGLPGAVVGVAPHSLRAVTPEELAAVAALAGDGPVHIHVAEQVKEVEDCVAWSGARPVEWLLSHAPVDRRWCAIHATHMTADETAGLARSGAVAGLCPITEANLGDGIFPLPAFTGAGGGFGVGSDSNVLISVAEELRTLEYSQRLGNRARNVAAAPGRSTGAALFSGALAGGSQALGCEAALKDGAPADLVSLDTSALPYLDAAQALDHWIFAGGVKPKTVWARGKRVVEAGRHVHRAAISARFAAAMRALLSA